MAISNRQFEKGSLKLHKTDQNKAFGTQLLTQSIFISYNTLDNR